MPDPDAPDGVRTEVLDPLGDDPPDPAPLARVLADPEVEVVVHAGRQDIAILRRTWDTEVTNVFDTQVAAGFSGFGNQEGYESLVRKVLGVKLKGSEGFTRWDRRPLTAQQLEYAADDARLLLELGDASSSGGWTSAAGSTGRARSAGPLEESTDERSAERVFERLPRLGRLNESARAVARELVEWREETARSADRPPGYVIPDQALIELARRSAARPRTGWSRSAGCRRRRSTAAATSCCRRSSAGASAPLPRRRRSRRPREPADAPLVSLAQALVRHRSMESDVAVELIATQAELAALVSALRRGEDGDHLRVAHGWRRELVGDELRELVAGRVA